MRDRWIEHLLRPPEVRAQLQVLMTLVQIAATCAIAVGAIVLILLVLV